MNGPSLHRIVIVGGGAGGLELATALGDKLGRRGLADITLIDAKLTHLWKPLLHEVAAGTLDSDADQLSYMAQARWHHFRYRYGRVDVVDRNAKQVQTAPTLDETGREFIPRRAFGYDTLILAVGSESNDFGVPGVREHCHFLDRQQQAEDFNRRLLRSFYTAHTQHEPLRPAQLHIAIAGAGATGIELAAELHHSTRELADYGLDRIEPDRHVKITVVEAAERVLPGLPARLSDRIAAQLRAVGIDILTGERIVEATADAFLTSSGRSVPAEIKVWAAGIRAPQFLASITGLESNRINQLVVKPTLQTTNDDSIFAFGDCAACPLGAGTVPPRAQAAHQQSSLLVRSMRQRLAGKPLPEYRYVDYGSLINMSRYSTVGSLMGNIARLWSSSIFVEGLFARLVYLSLYKMHQFALHGMVRVGLITIANLLTRRTKPRLKLH
jgi:NADH dehydrogenase